MLPAEQNFEMHYVGLLAIVEGFKIRYNYLEGAANKILVPTGKKILKKLIETTLLSD